MNALDLLDRFRGGAQKAPSEDSTAARIIDAARNQLELFGIQRTTMDDVARRAGVSRVTVYRHFENKDVLVDAVIMREVRRFLRELGEFADNFDDDEEQIVEAFGFIVTTLRNNRLVQRLLVGEPELFIPQLTTNAGPLIALARSMIVEYTKQRMPDVPEADLAVAAEVGIRLTISLLLTPDSVVDLDDPEQLRAVSARLSETLLMLGDRAGRGSD